MDENTLRDLANQLHQPSGKLGLEVAQHMNHGNAFINHFTIEHLQIQPADVILEIGPGNGYFAREILEYYPLLEYHGVDFSELMITEAKKMNAPFVDVRRAFFHHTSADALPFASDAFDRIFGVNVLYFWDNPVRELSELGRVLKPGGRMVLGVRSADTLREMPVTQFGFNIYEKKDIEHFVDQTELKLIDITSTREVIQSFKGEDWEVETWAVVLSK